MHHRTLPALVHVWLRGRDQEQGREREVFRLGHLCGCKESVCTFRPVKKGLRVMAHQQPNKLQAHSSNAHVP